MPRLTVYPVVALRDAARAHRQRDRRDPRGTARAARASCAQPTSWLEAQRLEQRTTFDLEMMKEVGYCSGIENYSRYLSGRGPGEPPPMPVRLPADGRAAGRRREPRHRSRRSAACTSGDRSRKETLVEYGFRLPSALDNRPLRFDEWEALAPQMIFVSATPGPVRGAHAGAAWSSRSCGRPGWSTRRSRSARCARRWTTCCRRSTAASSAHERVLVTTLTKRMAEDLTEYLDEHGVQGALPALGHRDRRARRDHPRPAPRQVRRAGRHQPAARGAGHARGVAGRDPRRRQGGLPALRRAR